jgi:hypothetical protein
MDTLRSMKLDPAPARREIRGRLHEHEVVLISGTKGRSMGGHRLPSDHKPRTWPSRRTGIVTRSSGNPCCRKPSGR